ncbi:hypothetical protein [Bosea sp. NPDC055594]
MTASPTPLFAEGSGAVPGSEPGMATGSKMELVQPAPAAMPSEEDGARTIYESNPRNKRWDLLADKVKDRYREQARAVLALFAPVLAEKERVERNRDMWKGQCERQAGTLRDLRMQMLADEGQSRAGIDGWHEQIKQDASIDSPFNACCYRDACRAMEARALAAEAALGSLRQAILDADIICDDDEKAGDRLSRLAAAIRAQGE